MPIFDCPEQNQTSPIITFLNISSDEPLIVNTYGPPALGVVIFVIQFPCLSAFIAKFLYQDAFIEITSLGFDQPQIETFVSLVKPYYQKRKKDK